MKPVALIIRTAGINCDQELAWAFQLAGAQVRLEHLNRLIAQPQIFQEVDLIGFPGGFSYGDDIAAGRIFANRLRHRLYEPLRQAIRRGVPMIGICNGFQVLVKLGLLPDPEAGCQTATLADNTCGRFVDKWCSLTVAPNTRCIWTAGLSLLDLPIAHAEGRFVPESDEALQRWQVNGQIVLRYVSDRTACPQANFPGNPNGSVDDIAGVCDLSGLVLGLMPHPERHVHPTHHPHWSRRVALGLAHSPDGLRFFQNAVQYVRERQAAPARI